MATIATRLTNTGTLLVNGTVDEVTQTTISTRVDTVYSAEFDEYTLFGGSVARRDNQTGSVQVGGGLDELTGAPVIDTSLKLWLDAAQPVSYSESGATWYDLSGTRANVTLYNAPAFSSTTTGGNLKFDTASLEYGETTVSLGNMPKWTVEAWFKPNATLTGQVTSVVCDRWNFVNSLNYSIGTNNAPVDYNLCVGFFDGAWHNTAGFVPTVGIWYQVVGTYDGTTLQQYVNGAANGAAVSYTGTSSSGGNVRIARRWDDTLLSTNLFPGDISVVRVYNRAFSADEVSQNFNAHRRRYNI